MKNLMSLKDAAEEVGIGYCHLFNLINYQRIVAGPSHLFGKRYFYKPAEVKALRKDLEQLGYIERK